MQVRVDAGDLAPELLLSVRVGNLRRQATLAALQQRALRFPEELCVGKTLKLELLQQVGSEVVVCSHEESYRVAFEAGQLALTVSPESGDQDDAASDERFEMDGLPMRRQDAAAGAKEYLEKHELLPYLQGLLETVCKEKPANPYRFLWRQLGLALDTSPPKKPAQNPTGPTGKAQSAREPEKGLPELSTRPGTPAELEGSRATTPLPPPLRPTSEEAGTGCVVSADVLPEPLKSEIQEALEAPSESHLHENVTEMHNRKPYKRGTIRKSPLYMNCMLAAPDGSRLCTLDRKKADWYIEKGIGKLTNLDPYTVQLNFEPSGRPGSEDSYYLNFKDNICVVCGSSKSYLRKNIVPHDYRRYFPLVLKDHHSHDVLLMCSECHRLSAFHDDKLKKELERKYNAPLGNASVARLVEDPDLKKVKSAAKALNYAGQNLPSARHEQLTCIVQEHFKTSSLTPEMIQEAATMETRKENSNYVSHGQEVVKKIREEGKLLEFEKMWRQHFLDTMRPRHLPPLWSVDHRHDSLKEKIEDLNDS